MIYGVAARKSFIHWNLASAAGTDVCIRSETAAPTSALCEIVIGSAHQQVATAKSVYLRPAFTVIDLLGALDRCGVWVLDMRSKSASVPESNAAYSLVRWLVLPQTMQSHRNHIAMARMTSAPQTLAQLVACSGLSAQDVDALVQHLQSFKALKIEQASVPGPEIRKLAEPASLGRVLKNWLNGALAGARAHVR